MIPTRVKPANLYQSPKEAVDIASWWDKVPYSEGARAKDKMHCPLTAMKSFLLPNHPYLFKQSIERVGLEEQFYCEIIAFIVGGHIGVEVPPAYVAYNSNTGDCGALIQWFYNPEGEGRHQVKFIHGTEYGLRLTRDFDPHKGRRHSANLMFCICRFFESENRFHAQDLFSFWFKVFAFDALIGNTDRHAHNWGVLIHATEYKEYMSFAPAFDNGTSLGYEQLSKNFYKFDDSVYLQKYIERGHHHVKWVPNDARQCYHLELLQIIAKRYPVARRIMIETLNFDFPSLEVKIRELTQFKVPVVFSEERCEFVIKLLAVRQKYLIQGLM